MNIDKFKHQHGRIFHCIQTLRQYAAAGIVEHAREIASSVIAMSSVIKLHLTVEDTVLYPALRASNRRSIARMGEEYRDEMKSIAASYDAFARKWNTPANVASDPEGFRKDANTVLKMLHARIRKEDKDFYPAVEVS